MKSWANVHFCSHQRFSIRTLDPWNSLHCLQSLYYGYSETNTKASKRTESLLVWKLTATAVDRVIEDTAGRPPPSTPIPNDPRNTIQMNQWAPAALHYNCMVRFRLETQRIVSRAWNLYTAPDDAQNVLRCARSIFLYTEATLSRHTEWYGTKPAFLLPNSWKSTSTVIPSFTTQNGTEIKGNLLAL